MPNLPRGEIQDFSPQFFDYGSVVISEHLLSNEFWRKFVYRLKKSKFTEFFFIPTKIFNI